MKMLHPLLFLSDLLLQSETNTTAFSVHNENENLSWKRTTSLRLTKFEICADFVGRNDVRKKRPDLPSVVQTSDA